MRVWGYFARLGRAKDPQCFGHLSKKVQNEIENYINALRDSGKE